jgi:hypothetical protein
MQTAAKISNPAAVPPSNDFLKRAIAMALELEQLLREDRSLEGREGFRLRLARAQALGVVDALTEVVCQLAAPLRVPAFESGVYSLNEGNRRA